MGARFSIFRAVVLTLAVATTACNRGCSCSEGEKTFDRLNGKVNVSLKRTSTKAATTPVVTSSFSVVIETKPPIEFPVECDHVDLAEDEVGKHVAFRCKGAGAWTVIRLRGDDRYIFECYPPIFSGTSPFTNLEPLSKSLDLIMECSDPLGRGHAEAQLVRAIVEDEGRDAGIVAAVRLATRGENLGQHDKKHGNTDPWEDALAALSPEHQKALLEQLCPVLVKPLLFPPASYVRAAERCALNGEPVRNAALAFFRERALHPTSRDVLATSLSPASQAFRWAAYVASNTMPVAGSIACNALKENGTVAEVSDTLHGVVAISGIRCEQARTFTDYDLCTCDGGLCDPKQVLAKFRTPIEGGAWAPLRESAPALGELRATPSLPPLPEMRFLALYNVLNGTLPKLCENTR